LFADEAAALLASIEAKDAQRKKVMPDEESAIRMMFEAGRRLKDFGWKDAVYCPKDGSPFLALEFGSTGQHKCVYEGDWPSGHWWIVADGDMSPSRPVLWKPYAAAPAPARHCDRGPDDCVQCSVLAGTFAVKSAAPPAPEGDGGAE
jgi:hypothetical protein